MKNLLTLLIQEIRLEFHGLKYVVILFFSLFIGIFISYFQVMSFNERVRECIEVQNEKNAEAKQAVVFSEFKIPIVISPNPLSIFAKGVDDKFGNLINISVEDLPEFENIIQKRNPFLAAFESFDVITIVTLVLSLLTLFLVSDIISVERDSETIKSIFANSVSKIEFLIAKFISSLLLISIPLFSILLIQTIFMVSIGEVNIRFQMLLQIFYLLGICLLYLAFYVIAGIIVSLITKTPAQSLVYAISIWLFLVVVFPNSIKYLNLQDRSKELYTNDELKKQLQETEDKWNKMLNEFQKKNWPSGGFSATGGYELTKNNLPGKIGLMNKKFYDFYRSIVEIFIPKLEELNQEKMKIYDKFRQSQLEQLASMDKYIKFLPEQILATCSYHISGTNYQSRVNLPIQYLREYRRTILKYLEQRNAFNYGYFTQMKEEDMIEDFDKYSNEMRKVMTFSMWKELKLNDIPNYDGIKFKAIFPSHLFILFFIDLSLIGLLFIIANKINYILK